MSFLRRLQSLTSVQRNTFIACFLGWSLDAFDFFILVFCVTAISADFHTKVSAIAEAIFITLAMRPVGGRLSGAVSGGDTVLWRGWKWGLSHTHESLIERFDPPVFFRDRMIAGRFAAFEHDHHFAEQQDGSVLLQDELRFRMKWGSAGAMLAHSMIMPHIRKLMRERFGLIKRLAEGEEWRTYID